MQKLTLALQDEMQAKIEGHNIIIEIPEECKRDLWLSQISYWLENASDEKLLESGFIRVEHGNKLKVSKSK